MLARCAIVLSFLACQQCFAGDAENLVSALASRALETLGVATAQHPFLPPSTVWTLRKGLARLLSLSTLYNVSLPKKSAAVLRSSRRVAGKSRDASVSLELLSSSQLCRNPQDRACSYAQAELQKREVKHAEALVSKQLASPLRHALQSLIKQQQKQQQQSKPQAADGACSFAAELQLGALEGLQKHAALAIEAGAANSTYQGALEALHSLRLSAKTLRYALEGQAALPGSQTTSGLRSLQGSLGRVNDALTLATTLGRLARDGKGLMGSLQSALSALQREAERLTSARLAELRVQWLAPLPRYGHVTGAAQASNLTVLLGTLAAALLPKATSGPVGGCRPLAKSEEVLSGLLNAGAPGVEVERRWILSALPPALGQWWAIGAFTDDLPLGKVKVVEMTQGYISGSAIRERLRTSATCALPWNPTSVQDISRCAPWLPHINTSLPPSQSLSLGAAQRAHLHQCHCTKQLVRSVKSGHGLLRMEREEVLQGLERESLFRGLWALTQGRRLSKRRFVVPVVGEEGEMTWEVDLVISGPRAGLVILEVELTAWNVTIGEGGKLAAEVPPTPPFPRWLAPFVGAEVTDSLSSSQLAEGLAEEG
jgi:CHAD domain-containing protein